jgi:hypothetical protein
MSRNALLGLSFVLLLIVYPLTALGTDGMSPVLWWAGIAALAVGGLIPPVLHFVDPSKSKGKDEEKQDRPDREERDGGTEGGKRRSATLTGLAPTGAPPGRELPRRVKKQIEESSRAAGKKGRAGRQKKNK